MWRLNRNQQRLKSRSFHQEGQEEQQQRAGMEGLQVPEPEKTKRLSQGDACVQQRCIRNTGLQGAEPHSLCTQARILLAVLRV